MNFDNFSTQTNTRERDLAMQKAMPVLMRKVFTWMTMTLVITGITAYFLSTSPAMMQMLYTSRMPILICAIIEVGIVFYVSARINRLSLQSATMWFILFSIINGATLGWIFMAYNIASITKTFLITAGTFGAMALIGYATKRDLSRLGSILMMAVIGLIIAGVVNIFLKSSMMDLIVSAFGVLIFTGLTAWDTQNIKKQLSLVGDVNEQAQKVALIGALSLYLDFVNLFLYLLRFLGDRK